MRVLVCLAVSASLLLVARPLHSQTSAVDVCNSIAQNAMRDISVQTGSSSSSSALYSNYCYADGSTNDSAINASGSAVVDALPISAAFASSDKQTRFKQFCSTYQASQAQAASSYSYQSLVVSKALDSVVDCLRAANNGYALSYKTITASTMVINFSIPPAGSLTVQGIQADSGVTCSGADLGHPGQTLTYAPGVGQTIGAANGANAITCTRASSGSLNGNTFYSDKAVIVSTSQGPLNIYWPQSTVLPLLTASTIQGNIDSLTAQVKAAQQAIAFNALPIGSIVPWLSNSNPPAGWTKCDGSDTAHCPDLNGRFLMGTHSGSAGSTGGSATTTEQPLGSNNVTPDGNGWSKDGSHFTSNDRPQLPIIPPYTAVVYIMKIANQ